MIFSGRLFVTTSKNTVEIKELSAAGVAIITDKVQLFELRSFFDLIWLIDVVFFSDMQEFSEELRMQTNRPPLLSYSYVTADYDVLLKRKTHSIMENVINACKCDYLYFSSSSCWYWCLFSLQDADVVHETVNRFLLYSITNQNNYKTNRFTLQIIIQCIQYAAFCAIFVNKSATFYPNSSLSDSNIPSISLFVFAKFLTVRLPASLVAVWGVSVNRQYISIYLYYWLF